MNLGYPGTILVISPHRDDEILGCGGLLAQVPPDSVHIRYYNSVHPNVPKAVYNEESSNVLRALGCGCSYSPLPNQKVNGLSTYNISVHIADIENIINSYRPNTILIPFPSYNQDHRHLFDAAITATRVHDVNWFVSNVLVYEQPETVQTNRLEPRFIPHVFVPIDIDKKLELFSLYQSQQRGHRTPEHIEALARVRGMQCNVSHAESFMVVRMTL